MFFQFTNPLKRDVRRCENQGSFTGRKRRRRVDSTVGFLAVVADIVRKGDRERDSTTICYDL